MTAAKFPELMNRDWLHEQYKVKGRSGLDIARQLGTSNVVVSNWLHKHGIDVRDRNLQPEVCGQCGEKYSPTRRTQRLCPECTPKRRHIQLKICKRCGEEYIPTGSGQRFCSQECRFADQKCEQCGLLFKAPAERKFCSFECQTAWRGENCSHRYMTDQGYVVVVKPPTLHEDINDNGYKRINLGTGRHGKGRVLEHRWVMEQQLGRPLLPTEEVHHKNTIKTDNDPSNLELWDTSQPKGGRVSDKIEWAAEFLSRYAPEMLRN